MEEFFDLPLDITLLSWFDSGGNRLDPKNDAEVKQVFDAFNAASKNFSKNHPKLAEDCKPGLKNLVDKITHAFHIPKQDRLDVLSAITDFFKNPEDLKNVKSLGDAAEKIKKYDKGISDTLMYLIMAVITLAFLSTGPVGIAALVGGLVLVATVAIACRAYMQHRSDKNASSQLNEQLKTLEDTAKGDAGDVEMQKLPPQADNNAGSRPNNQPSTLKDASNTKHSSANNASSNQNKQPKTLNNASGTQKPSNKNASSKQNNPLKTLRDTPLKKDNGAVVMRKPSDTKINKVMKSRKLSQP